jgi:hypothetical protein
MRQLFVGIRIGARRYAGHGCVSLDLQIGRRDGAANPTETGRMLGARRKVAIKSQFSRLSPHGVTT